MILHLVSKADWDALKADQPYVAASLASEGFIHCTAGEALMLDVANRFYKDQPGEFVLLEIDESKLTSEVKWEAPADPKPAPAVETPPEAKAEYGEQAPAAVLFPHVYGPINRDAVVGVRKAVRDTSGAFTGSAERSAAPAAAATANATSPAEDPLNLLNLKPASQLADELLDATDGFSEALKRYKDKIESRIEGLDDEIKKKL